MTEESKITATEGQRKTEKVKIVEENKNIEEDKIKEEKKITENKIIKIIEIMITGDRITPTEPQNKPKGKGVVTDHSMNFKKNHKKGQQNKAKDKEAATDPNTKFRKSSKKEHRNKAKIEGVTTEPSMMLRKRNKKDTMTGKKSVMNPKTPPKIGVNKNLQAKHQSTLYRQNPKSSKKPLKPMSLITLSIKTR